MSTRPPLILSYLAHDIHAAAACWGLRRCSLSPVWIDSWADPAMPPFSLYCDAAHGLTARGGPVADGIGSIWFRRPRNPELFPHAHGADLPFLRNEWRRFVDNLHSLSTSFGDAFWINPPAAAIDAENKMVQLRAANRVGLPFPATLMSSDPDEIRRFTADHGRVVYKPFQTHTWQDAASGKMYSTYARVIEQITLGEDESLRQCPGIYQQRVDKLYDIRATVIGNRVFAARLDTPAQGDFLDWRVASLGGTLQAQATDLPTGFTDRLRALMRELRIVFGCIDLAVDAAGDLHFLEVNQAGQFLFLEQAVPSLQMLRAMCALLVQGRTDYDLDAMPTLSYDEYLASDEYREWWAHVSPGIKGKDGSIPGVSVE